MEDHVLQGSAAVGNMGQEPQSKEQLGMQIISDFLRLPWDTTRPLRTSRCPFRGTQEKMLVIAREVECSRERQRGKEELPVLHSSTNHDTSEDLRSIGPDRLYCCVGGR